MDINNSLPLLMPLENNQFFKQFANPPPQINMADLLNMPQPQDIVDYLLLLDPTFIYLGIL